MYARDSFLLSVVFCRVCRSRHGDLRLPVLGPRPFRKWVHLYAVSIITGRGEGGSEIYKIYCVTMELLFLFFFCGESARKFFENGRQKSLTSYYTDCAFLSYCRVTLLYATICGPQAYCRLTRSSLTSWRFSLWAQSIRSYVYRKNNMDLSFFIFFFLLFYRSAE